MNIAVIGLGLIGGSIAKAMKVNTPHRIFGYDIQESVVLKAKLLEAIDAELTEDMFPCCEMVIVALYPKAAVDYIKNAAPYISKSAVVVDCCGVKEFVCEQVRGIASEYGFTFIGGHPMAGIERSGFEHSYSTLFSRASMILTPEPDIDVAVLDRVRKFFLSIGFGKITIRTPAEHDRIIAYTSQLAHVLSSAYIQSPAAPDHRGLSAGSFRDMTRVSTMNEAMWSELFFENRENLIEEIDGLIARLQTYSDALKEHKAEKMMCLLRDGTAMKAKCDAEQELS